MQSPREKAHGSFKKQKEDHHSRRTESQGKWGAWWTKLHQAAQGIVVMIWASIPRGVGCHREVHFLAYGRKEMCPVAGLSR